MGLQVLSYYVEIISAGLLGGTDVQRFAKRPTEGQRKKKIMGPGSSTRFQHIPLVPVDRRILVGNLPSLTASLHLKMDGWKMKCPKLGPGLFSGANC